jgi:hydrogenase maturation protease
MVRILGAVRVVVAGFGNVLRADDGFGVAVANRLVEDEIPAGVEVLEVGIGGIHLVQDLIAEPADGLVILDALELGRPPGTVVVLRPDVLDVLKLDVHARRDHLADMHYATPERALMLAAAMGVLPAATMLVGCQPIDADGIGEGLSHPVAMGVEQALVEVRRVVSEMGIDWPVTPAGT